LDGEGSDDSWADTPIPESFVSADKLSEMAEALTS